LAAAALALATAIGLPLGIWIGHTGRGAAAVIAIANTGRAVPSVGWLGIVFPLTLLALGRGGLGFVPSVIALTALGIPPIVTNTYAGMREVDREFVEAGRGMGMTALELVRGVEVPIALPVVLAGIRVSAVQVVATATLATIVGGGTLGAFIVQGIDVRALDRVVGAAILVALLAILTELAFTFVERRTVSPGLRGGAQPAAMESARVLPPQ
jgi:osmoprotectant transport system permease protein